MFSLGRIARIGLVHEKINDQGELTDEPAIKHLDLVAENFVKWMEIPSRLKQLQSEI
ncbi:hypothetical protein HMSSN036_59370 [Paenibacillus macerans]|nr:hypothetical protein HMSSN036_59370 [Paenibacillus macerans]